MMKRIATILFLSIFLNIYLGYRLYIHNTKNINLLYNEECPQKVEANRICSVEIIEKRSDFLSIKLRYHYIKGEEGKTKVSVKANNGTHDNVVGTRGGHYLKEGDNTIVLPFGLYRSDIFDSHTPYLSKYIAIRAQGISTDGKTFITPDKFSKFIEYNKSWYANKGDLSW